MALINFTGLASGIDANALIAAIMDQKRKAQVQPLKTKIETFKSTNDAFDKLKELLNNLKSSVDAFRSINGGGVSKLASSSNAGVFSAVAGNSAQTGSYDITVTQLAKNGVLSFGDSGGTGRFNSSAQLIDSSLASTETVTIAIGTGSSQESIVVDVDASTTAQDFINRFNSQSKKAAAALVNTGTSSAAAYAIVITSNDSGTEQGEITAPVLSSPIANLSTSTLEQATNAVFAVNGIDGTISRSSNTINDVIQGVTLSLQSTGGATLRVGTDPDSTTEQLQEFVDAYNEILKFIKKHDTVTREGDGEEATNIFGALAGTSVDENIITSLRSAFSSSGTSGRAVNILADLGITTERDGTLAFDREKLASALKDDPEGVNIITRNLGDKLAAVDGTIAQYTRFNGLIDDSLKSNRRTIDDSEKRISYLESQLAREEETLLARFARLESLIGRMQSQQSVLVGLLPQ